MRKRCLVWKLLFHTEPQMSHETMEGAHCRHVKCRLPCKLFNLQNTKTDLFLTRHPSYELTLKFQRGKISVTFIDGNIFYGSFHFLKARDVPTHKKLRQILHLSSCSLEKFPPNGFNSMYQRTTHTTVIGHFVHVQGFEMHEEEYKQPSKDEKGAQKVLQLKLFSFNSFANYLNYLMNHLVCKIWEY